MGLPSVLNTGYSGLSAAKAAIATTGHNVSNANTEGFSRQRVLTESAPPQGSTVGKGSVGTGTHVARIERVNDQYVEKQIRDGYRELCHYEEKDLALRQIEDIFNEMNGDGLNRLISQLFNDFRKLSMEPESSAIRQSIKESAQAMVNDFRRIRKGVDGVRSHLDSRLDGYCLELNSYAEEVADLNRKISMAMTTSGLPNDLLDKRDLALKKLASYVDISTHEDKNGNINVDLKGLGPLVIGQRVEPLSVSRTPSDENGKKSESLDIMSTAAVGPITHLIKGGKIGALVEARDVAVTSTLRRLDELAYRISKAVNDIHSQGVSARGEEGVLFFSDLEQIDGAAESFALSQDILTDIGNIATAINRDSPGDNTIAVEISKLQNEKIFSDGTVTCDEWYNSIVTEVGVASSRNRFALNQQKDVMEQLGKIRERISGVSIDEETANLLQFQKVFEASAKVIQVADEMLRTVLALKRD